MKNARLKLIFLMVIGFMLLFSCSLDELNNLNDDQPAERGLIRSKYKPSGYIYIRDTDKGVIPLTNVKVYVRNWLKTATATTNSRGYFQVSKEFKGKVDFFLIFDNSHADIRSLNISISDIGLMRKPAKFKIKNEARSVTYIIERSEEVLWSVATVQNNIEYYHKLCAEQGITAPSKLKVLVHTSRNGGASSAPMLSKIGISNLSDTHTGFLANFYAINLEILRTVVPDIYLNINKDSLPESDEIAEVVYHEFGHASHFTKVGADFWLKFVILILDNGRENPYGEKSDPDSGRIAISEAWGYHTGYYFTYLRYKNTHYYNILEYFDPQLYWIPKGIFYDLMDEKRETVPVLDNVEGFTMRQIFSVFSSDITSPQKYRDKLYNTYPGISDFNSIESLFKEYGY